MTLVIINLYYTARRDCTTCAQKKTLSDKNNIEARRFMQIIILCVCLSDTIRTVRNGCGRPKAVQLPPPPPTTTTTTTTMMKAEPNAKTHKTAGDCYLNKYGGESHTYIYIRVYSTQQRRRKGRCVYHVQRCAGRGVELSVRIYTHSRHDAARPSARSSVRQTEFETSLPPRLYMYTCSCIILGCTALSSSSSAVVCIVFFEPARCKLPLPIRQPSSRPGSLL